MMPQKIAHFRQPAVPGFRFEWHPHTKKVYVIRAGQNPEIAELIAWHVDSLGLAHNTVLVWCRGYRTRAAEIQREHPNGQPPHNQSLVLA